MALDERVRHNLYARLQKVWGEQEGTTLIEYLPSAEWADLATRSDPDHLIIAAVRAR